MKVTTKGNEELYKVVLPGEITDFQILRKDSTGTDQWGYTSKGNKGSDVTTVGSTNIYVVYDQQTATDHWYADWASASVAHVTLVQPTHGTITVQNHNGEQNGEGYYYSDWSLDFTLKPNSPYTS